MSRRKKEQFQTINVSGAMLPPDLLRKISALNKDKTNKDRVPGLTADSYHLPESTKLNEAIAQSWSVIQAHWKSFTAARDQLADDDTGTTITNDRWLLPLFKELEYGRLTTTEAPVIDEKTYPIRRLYNNTPIHLIGCNLPLDRRTKGAAGAATASPHAMVQEYLNRSDDHLWAFLSNGLQLRILRDNVSLSRQAFVEFDLEAMMDGEIYSDFALLWLLCHQSRVEAKRQEDCWLEQWSKLAREAGTRVMNELRNGVAKAIEALGRGFIGHPRNDQLREKLQETGDLSKDDYYRQLLRIVYRLLFLFVAEDRGLLHPPDADESACDLYDSHYSTRRLRDMSEKLRGSKHADLWHSLSLVFARLEEQGCDELGLIGLGSFLWKPSSTSDLLGPSQTSGEEDPVLITNDDLLTAIRALAYVEQDRVLRSVDYRNLGSEELGSVYESLLELHPDIHVEAKQFDLRTAAGNERKTTGSYYTPDSLVQCLLDSALDPVVEARLAEAKKVSRAGSNPDSFPDWFTRLPTSDQQSALAAGYAQVAEQALLALKVCDPACGSGHFLIAAAHRLARHLARVRTGESEPSPADYQHALRDIIGRCIYGVDINPMAIELCKVSLWMEAIDPGRPLTFLDHRIQCGNSLLGTTPALLVSGIPDDAFKPIEGDVKTVASGLKKQNKMERKDREKGQGRFEFEPNIKLGDLPASFARLSSVGDESVAAVVEKERLYASLVSGADYQNARLLADTWCAVFVWKKDESEVGRLCPTENDLRKIENDPFDSLPHVKSEVRRLADQYQFFHWHLAFPDVFQLPIEKSVENKQAGWNGGFDVVLGNPPWEALSPDSKEFFSKFDASVRFQDRRGQASVIETLLENEDIQKAWTTHCRVLYAAVHFFKTSGRYTMYAPGNLGKGDFNSFRVFVETALRTTALNGRTAQLVPEQLYNGANCMAIRNALFETLGLIQIWGFENTGEVWFKGVHTAAKFCLYCAENCQPTSSAFSVAFRIRTESYLREVSITGGLGISVDTIRSFSPIALAIPELASQQDVDIAEKAYQAFPVLGDLNAGEPRRDFLREVDMGNDRHLFSDADSGLPVYEGRMISNYDNRAKKYVSGRGRAAVWEELDWSSPQKDIHPQWYIPKRDIPGKIRDRVNRNRIAICAIGSPSNHRSLCAALIPKGTVCGHSVITLVFDQEHDHWMPFFLGVANSFTMDFLIRQKVSLNITMTILDSLPFPRISQIDTSVFERVTKLVLGLSCTSPELASVVSDYNFANEVVLLRDYECRLRANAEIEALVSRDVFGYSESKMEFMMDTFNVAEKYDRKRFGTFRTKELIMEYYKA